MDVKGYRCLTLSLKSFLVVLLLHLANVRAANASAFARITECSVRHLNFTLTETPGGSIVYDFQAACLDTNGSCVYGKSHLDFGVVPSRTFQVSVDTSCSLSNKLSPNGSGLCTLQISTSDVVVETAGIAFLESCTLPPLSSVVSSASRPTTEVGQASIISKPVSVVSSAVSNAPMATPTPDASEFARITECSVRHLNFTLSETPGGTIAYYFQAACMDNNGNCVDGESQLGFGVVPSRTFQVSLDTSCSLSNKLSPNGSGLCTLQISTTDVLAETAGIAFLESCTLPPLSSVVSSASMPTTEVGQASTTSKPVSVVSSAVSNAPMATPTPGEDQISVWLVPVIAIIASFLLMAILLIVVIVPLIMWMRHSRPKSQEVAFEQKDVLKTSISGFLGFEGDIIAVDNVTLYEVVREEKELGSRTGLSVTDGSSESDFCDEKSCSTMEAPLTVSSGYVVGIQYTNMHQ